MNEVILFPDAVEVVTDYLAFELPLQMSAATVGTRVPKQRPAEFVTVRRIGGTASSLVIDNAQLSVECWATSEAAAADLAQLVRGLVHAMAGTTQGSVAVYRVTEIGGPAMLPDPDSDTPRYVATYQIGMRGRAV